MKPTTPFFLLAGLTSTIATPVSMAAAETWTLVNLTRTCDEADTQCDWTFSINASPPDDTAVPCDYTVVASGDTPASQANGGPTTCGAYNLTSGWSGQFGPDAGFTTLSVVDYARKLIAYAGYTDAQLAKGVTVEPDQSYPVQNLP
ncbi:uncharacterized protein BCR38DRAFT_451609 [Pseudomassariella vexata]|uniref:Small secreted protein n=1 Tax=Pseudomassariella vexata TaxID=1141098 RepID=A0A1Y2DA55_9PEZI|nr:uncharacterized protein BCR38DRAFT_451609 [Pseudomassariella vexata]ORY56151.1 hypothetical protein BCR38DRAFT_451609 [Pseudomassariella vexata]